MTFPLIPSPLNPGAVDRLLEASAALRTPRLEPDQYNALREVFGDDLLKGGYGNLDRRLLNSEAGRKKLAEVLGKLGFPADPNDRASLAQGIQKVQAQAGLPITGDLDPALLVLMALAAQSKQNAPAQPAAPGGPLFNGPQNAPRFGAGAPAGTVPAHQFGGPPSREFARPALGGGVPVPAGEGTNTVGVRPMRQSNSGSKSVSCGQASVAMAVNALTGKNLTDQDVNGRYGFGLLNALNAESGRAWRDHGNLSTSNLAGFSELIDRKVNQEKTPVVIGLGGTFTASNGHIVTIVGYDKATDKVTYADPADGKVKTTTLAYMASQPPHQDGRFVFATS